MASTATESCTHGSLSSRANNQILSPSPAGGVENENAMNLAPISTPPAPSAQQVESAERVRDAFGKFVGQTMFAQMLSSMRQTVGKPAYFDGGRGEEVFRGQLDQVLAEKLSENDNHGAGDSLADRMFNQQFPQHAAVLKAAAKGDAAGMQPLDTIGSLRRW